MDQNFFGFEWSKINFQQYILRTVWKRFDSVCYLLYILIYRAKFRCHFISLLVFVIPQNVWMFHFIDFVLGKSFSIVGSFHCKREVNKIRSDITTTKYGHDKISFDTKFYSGWFLNIFGQGKISPYWINDRASQEMLTIKALYWKHTQQCVPIIIIFIQV